MLSFSFWERGVWHVFGGAFRNLVAQRMQGSRRDVGGREKEKKENASENGAEKRGSIASRNTVASAQ